MPTLLNLIRASLLGLTLLLTGHALAVIDVYQFDSEEQRLRYLEFIEEMRCPKCQNQNLSGSDSPIAADLRREIHRLLQEGKSDDEIVEFMVARYGEFILYEPRMQSSTYILWLAPIGMLLVGLVVAILMSRRKNTRATVDDVEKQARLKALLNANEQDK
ncbi:cytochrome c-type biogenesis protein [Simiduia agarivorans]|uniref:Cytochrome c-type biogenesis protein n=1 Tax=Simiduia agarivorans (strain DSM 21679 / JCM 13881 / BCRC 17597 / SA1) TaxID=1117647 RepID=K4KE39_SIMAS|nr:cytochrome c-type biogenesis protein [Simiduia agarivorans]AFU97299.1 CcmH family cytochrome c biogenesis protein [Simiduia agarivorans SA1 = DSM 21679]